jgi:protein-L-isoaspartate(D-aspartate) O-methyltransferase
VHNDPDEDGFVVPIMDDNGYGVPAAQPADVTVYSVRSLTESRTMTAWLIRRLGPTLVGVSVLGVVGAAPLPASDQGCVWHPPIARSAKECADERRRMVADQIASPVDGREAVTDRRVLEAMLAVPRHAFVPLAERASAYADTPLPIGYGQTISQPYVVALMTTLLRLRPRDKVLEIGTGSGYQAAVLAHLTPHVYTIEIVQELAETAGRNLRDQGYHDIRLRLGDGHLGWPEAAPFDAIIVTCAPDDLPEPLWAQLSPGGRIVIPIGSAGRVQRLVVVSKTPDGQRRTQIITDVRFVPMVREPIPRPPTDSPSADSASRPPV